jgi:hypothetical protein
LSFDIIKETRINDNPILIEKKPFSKSITSLHNSKKTEIETRNMPIVFKIVLFIPKKVNKGVGYFPNPLN